MRAVRFLLLFATLVHTGCVKQLLINGQIESTRQASVSLDSIGDWELGYRALASAIAQFEGMHLLAPSNEDALYLLTAAWTAYGYGFVEDDLEEAEDQGDRGAIAHHRQRAVKAYARAIESGLASLRQRNTGLDAALSQPTALKAFLDTHTNRADAPLLFWIAYAWTAQTSLVRDDANAMARLWIAVEIMQRSVTLDPTYYNWGGTIILAAYHARAITADMDQARTLFEKALTATKRGAFIAQFLYATKWACAKADGATYQQLLTEVLTRQDDEPSRRMNNAIARRRALRWLAKGRMSDACGIDVVPTTPK